jgi:predicted RNase H-like HicB family nuclease
MRYKVVLQHSEQGVSASVPGLPGCGSQGENEAEALANISSAIKEYLGVVGRADARRRRPRSRSDGADAPLTQSPGRRTSG